MCVKPKLFSTFHLFLSLRYMTTIAHQKTDTWPLFLGEWKSKNKLVYYLSDVVFSINQLRSVTQNNLFTLRNQSTVLSRYASSSPHLDMMLPIFNNRVACTFVLLYCHEDEHMEYLISNMASWACLCRIYMHNYIVQSVNVFRVLNTF